MYILQNALHNLLRNKGRNLMIGAIVFVIIVSSVTALMINNTASGVIEDYKGRFGSEVALTPNMNRLQQEAQAKSNGGPVSVRRPEIAPEDLIKFGQSEYLKEAVYTASGKGNSEQLKPIDEEKGAGGGPMLQTTGANGDVTQDSPGRHYFHQLLGNQYEDFKNGLRVLTEGSRYPENKGECIISTELLENSGLSIGDTITVTSALENPGSEPGSESYTDFSWELTIVGTFLDATDEYSTGMIETAYANRRNEILTNFDTIAEKIIDGYHGINAEATFYLKSPDLVDAFAEEVYAKGLSDVYDVTTDAASYDTIIKPVEGLKGISIAFCIIVLVFGAVIIALLSSIAIRERKYEIGVLRAMGMEKGKVVLGLWAEMLVLTSLCLIIGLGVGTLVAQPVTNVMLEQQVSAAEKANEAANALPPGAVLSGPKSSGNGSGVASDVQPLDELDVSLDIITLLEIIGIAILLSSLAALIATQKITKYEPIKILMERN